MKVLICLIILTTSCVSLSSKELPSKFEDNLIYLTPTLQDGKVIRFYTDTGGGWNVISEELVDSYNWPVIKKESDREIAKLVEMPTFLESSSIPVGGLNNFMEGKLFVAPLSEIDRYASDYDASLGGRWHAEKIIQFDYIHQTITHHSELPAELSEYKFIKLGFQKTSEGAYTTAFPSIDMTIDGHSHKMLFDTGAMAVPAKRFKKELNSKYLRVATSFIVASVFDDWRKKHPEWLVLEGACQLSGEDMIRVPKIVVAGELVGPVWFTRRADHNFHEYMSSMMDTRVDGALGGSALKFLDIIIDYPSEQAYISSGTKK